MKTFSDWNLWFIGFAIVLHMLMMQTKANDVIAAMNCPCQQERAE